MLQRRSIRAVYTSHTGTVAVTTAAGCASPSARFNLTTVIARQNAGVKQVADRVRLISFMQYVVGFFDDETKRLEPVENRSRRKCYRCAPDDLLPSPEQTRCW